MQLILCNSKTCFMNALDLWIIHIFIIATDNFYIDVHTHTQVHIYIYIYITSLESLSFYVWWSEEFLTHLRLLRTPMLCMQPKDQTWCNSRNLNCNKSQYRRHLPTSWGIKEWEGLRFLTVGAPSLSESNAHFRKSGDGSQSLGPNPRSMRSCSTSTFYPTSNNVSQISDVGRSNL